MADRILDDAAIADLKSVADGLLVETCDVYTQDGNGRWTVLAATAVPCLMTRPSTMAQGTRAVGIKERLLLHAATLTMPKDARVAHQGSTYNVVSGTQWVRRLYGTQVMGECTVELVG
jgi:hypothetical protein